MQNSAAELNDDGNGRKEQEALDAMAASSIKLLKSIQATYPQLVPYINDNAPPKKNGKPIRAKTIWPGWYDPPAKCGFSSMRELIAAVGAQFGFNYAEMVGPSRVRHLAQARQTAYAVIRSRGNSTTQIGRWMNRDHSTVIHGLKMFEVYAAREPRMMRVYDHFVGAGNA